VQESEAFCTAIGEVDQSAQLEYFDALFVGVFAGQSSTADGPDDNVFQDGHAAEGAGDLEGSSSPEVAGYPHGRPCRLAFVSIVRYEEIDP
jgi:hypothetical protein